MGSAEFDGHAPKSLPVQTVGGQARVVRLPATLPSAEGGCSRRPPTLFQLESVSGGHQASIFGTQSDDSGDG